MSKRSLFIFIFSGLSFLVSNLFFLVSPTFAQSESPMKALYQTQSAMKEGTGLEAWTSTGVDITGVKILNTMTGEIPENFLDTGGSAAVYIPGGALGTMNNLVASLYTPPASGIEYIAQVKDSFLGKPAYAQGVGFKGLQFLLPIWRGFRNAVYVLASIIFIAVGIMIMLRVKISPQAVVTVQSAIPQLITTLILVTFSYAIAGLVIDICNFVQALVVALLFSVKGVPLTESLFPGWWGSGFPVVSDVINGISSIFTGNNFDFASLSNPNLTNLQMLTYRAVPGWLSLVMLGGLLGSIVAGFFLGGLGNIAGAGVGTIADMVGRGLGGGIGGLLGGILVPIILCIIVAIWLIKLYFGLLKNYVTIIFKIVLAPLEIAIGAFPNSKMGFTSWILDVTANMAVFPVVGIFLVLLNMIVDAVSVSNVGSTGGVFSSPVWAPSLLSAGGISPSIIGAAIGLAGLALVSKLPEMVPQFIFMIKPSPWGQAIGQGLGDIGKPAKMGGQMMLEGGVRTAQNRRDVAETTQAGPSRLQSVLGSLGDALETGGFAKGNRKGR